MATGTTPPLASKNTTQPEAGSADLITLGRRIRHFRKIQSLTLDSLSSQVGVVPSQLSLVENGRREPRLSLLNALADALGVTVSELLSAEPPDQRTALEIELEQAQRGSLYQGLALPSIPASDSSHLERPGGFRSIDCYGLATD